MKLFFIPQGLCQYVAGLLSVKTARIHYLMTRPLPYL